MARLLGNTLVFYIVGDNGASAEGGAAGVLTETGYFSGLRWPLWCARKSNKMVAVCPRWII
jgi:hypothetical protein